MQGERACLRIVVGRPPQVSGSRLTFITQEDWRVQIVFLLAGTQTKSNFCMTKNGSMFCSMFWRQYIERRVHP